ncbi:MAG: dephospho-CoA kinase, partial [Anaerolineae bacterium]|nr:dephospho-CoA kinase [Anaerolineae bacterium]
AMEKLEKITHPIIRQAIDLLVKRAKQRIVVVEAIKLLEGDLADMVDAVWVVDAKPQTQYKRLVLRRKMSEENAKRRILAQGKQNEKLEKANVVIRNDGSVEDTWKQVQAQWGEIRKQLTGQGGEPVPNEEETTVVQSAEGLTVKRGMPGNADSIANFISERTGKSISRMDVMMTFGQKSYLLAAGEDEKMVGLMGWTVENLVTRMDEFYLANGYPVQAIAQLMVKAVEESSKELQSEVGFIFLPSSISEATVKAFNSAGYEPITLNEIKVPVWREVVEEATASNPMTILWKQLRKDRVLQPI